MQLWWLRSDSEKDQIPKFPSHFKKWDPSSVSLLLFLPNMTKIHVSLRRPFCLLSLVSTYFCLLIMCHTHVLHVFSSTACFFSFSCLVDYHLDYIWLPIWGLVKKSFTDIKRKISTQNLPVSCIENTQSDFWQEFIPSPLFFDISYLRNIGCFGILLKHILNVR